MGLGSLWGTSATNVFAAGDGGVLRFDGQAWREDAQVSALMRRRSLNDLMAMTTIHHCGSEVDLPALRKRHPNIDYSTCLCDLSPSELTWWQGMAREKLVTLST